MDRRLLYAVLISIAFLFAWGSVAPKLFPELAKPRTARPDAAQQAEPPAVATTEEAARPVDVNPAPAIPQVTAGSPAASPAERILPATAAEEIVVDRPGFRATFRNRGAQLTSFVLKQHHTKGGGDVDLVKARDAARIDFPFALISGDADWNRSVNSQLWRVDRTTEGSSDIIRFRVSDPSGRPLEKTFTFTDQWDFGFEISGPKDLPFRTVIGPGIRTLEPGQVAVQGAIDGNPIIQFGEEFDRIDKSDLSGLRVYEAPSFVGLQDNYFVVGLRPKMAGAATIKPLVTQRVVEDGKAPVRDTEVYAGLNDRGGVISGVALFVPKQADLLDKYGMEGVLNLGFFGIIARFLLVALEWIYRYTHNYGWAIVILTVIIKILFYPLQHKSMVSMKKMQKLQPKMNAIKDKYKKARSDMEQRQKMNQEMMALYSREGINPMSGCVPILLQLPILWGFYSLLSAAIELRGAEWILWITDLSVRDPYYVTPILMTATMFIQQLLTPMTGDPLQRRIFLLMPLIFGWIFKEFPSGLVLYWLVQNILTIIQQLIMNKYWKEHPEQLASARA